MAYEKRANDLVCVSNSRTPFGRFGGALKDVDVYDLGAVPVKNAVNKINIDNALIDEVWWGNGDTTSSKDSFTPCTARQTMLKAGFPPETPSNTFDQACTSAMTAVLYGWRGIQAGKTQIFMAGGSTSFSKIPFLLRNMRWQGHKMADLILDDPIVPLENKDYDSVARESGIVALDYQVSREEQDEFAVRSHINYGKAWNRGFFKQEMEPFELVQKDRKGNVISTKVLDIDEQYRPNVDLANLTKLPTMYGSPTVTAGNAPGMNDGAVAQIFMTRERAEALGLEVLYTVVSISAIAMQTALMPLAPAFALKKCLNESNLAIEDMKYHEINEAFACVPLCSAKLLANERFLTSDYKEMLHEVYKAPVLDYSEAEYEKFKSRLNVNGSAIAIGHPNTASGSRIMMTLANNLRENGGGYGSAAICGGLTQAAGCVIYVE